jgi:hypothetical protein
MEVFHHCFRFAALELICVSMPGENWASVAD